MGGWVFWTDKVLIFLARPCIAVLLSRCNIFATSSIALINEIGSNIANHYERVGE